MPGKWSASPSQATWQDILGSSVLMVCSRCLECLSGCCSWMLRLTKEAKLQYVRNEMMVIIKNAWFRNLWMLLLSRTLHQKQLAVDLNWNYLTQRMGTCLTSEQTLVIISAAGYAHSSPMKRFGTSRWDIFRGVVLNTLLKSRRLALFKALRNVGT